MNREDLKRIMQQSKDRFILYPTSENLFYISELLYLESDKLEKDQKIHLSIKLRKITMDLDHLLDLYIKSLESEEEK